ncbi:N-acetylmannosaminyltransferase [hydrothermal vent metagenome]|uniref:N-acetylmannosaminyltransferase n=1 Tax=hydrothermal vent metagenome TaxID=652676 RepID=A0A3B1BC50_9ZZZZ
MAESNTFKVANFIGIGIDAVTYEDIFNSIDKWIANKEGRSHHIACVNAFCVTLALKNKRLARIYNGADITGPDGVPFVKWIKRTLKVPCDRIAAPDTILELAKHSKTTGYTFYLYGGDPDVVVKMKQYLEDRFPHIRIVGYYSPPFRALTEEEDAAICEEINRLKPDIISVGLGTPKQDYWIEDHLYKIRGSVLIASGATFDFFGGRIKMAPEFIRKSGFEWLYRLFSKDFLRLWRRYILMNMVFMWNFGLQNLHIKTRTPEKWQRPETRN